MRILKRWIAPVAAISAFEWSIISICQWVTGTENFFLNKESTILKIYVFTSTGLILYILWISIVFLNDLRRLKRQNTRGILNGQTGRTNTDSLSLILKNAYNEKRWSEVIKIGHQLSEPLWYTGKFYLRIKIGELVAIAAAFENKEYIQAETLIDDLGWTNCRLNNQTEAKKNLRLGLRIASKINNHYLISKAYRHFADISLSHNSFEECLEYLKHSFNAMRQIENYAKKIEMNGNLQYTISKYYFAKNNNKKAIKAACQSQLLYKSIDDSDRQAKLFYLKGKIFISENKEEDAMASFQEGLILATRISNIVNIVSNSSALAECYLRNERFDIAKSMIDIAWQNSKAMDDPILIEKIEKISKIITEKGST